MTTGQTAAGEKDMEKLGGCGGKTDPAGRCRQPLPSMPPRDGKSRNARGRLPYRHATETTRMARESRRLAFQHDRAATGQLGRLKRESEKQTAAERKIAWEQSIRA